MPHPLHRCAWAKPTNELMLHYHDTEWGTPTYDDQVLFEFLILESAQAGLAWDTILRKRHGYREAFAHFDPVQVARFGQSQISRLLKNPRIVRNKLKIIAAITNARAFLAVQKEFGTFATYLWAFVGYEPINGKRQSEGEIPVTTKEATALAHDLKRRGFRFFGPTIAYAYLQATGVVNDHVRSCFRYPMVHSKQKAPHFGVLSSTRTDSTGQLRVELGP